MSNMTVQAKSWHSPSHYVAREAVVTAIQQLIMVFTIIIIILVIIIIITNSPVYY